MPVRWADHELGGLGQSLWGARHTRVHDRPRALHPLLDASHHTSGEECAERTDILLLLSDLEAEGVTGGSNGGGGQWCDGFEQSIRDPYDACLTPAILTSSEAHSV